MGERCILKGVLMKLLCCDTEGFQLLISNHGSHLAAGAVTHINSIDQSHILNLLMGDILQPVLISLLRNDLHHQLRFHGFIVCQLPNIKLGCMIHYLHKLCFHLLQNVLIGTARFIGLKGTGHIEICLDRGVPAAERNPTVGFSLELLHIPDPDPHIGKLRRQVFGKPGLQILFHLFQKLLIIHLTSSFA